MTDLVERIRKWRDERGFPTPGELLDEAAAEIARLTADVERHKMTPQERAVVAWAADTVEAYDFTYGDVWSAAGKPLRDYLDRTKGEAE